MPRDPDPRVSKTGRISGLRVYTAGFFLAALLLAPIQTGPAFSGSKEVYKIPKPVKPTAKADTTKLAAYKPGPEADKSKAPAKPEYVYNPAGKTDPFKPFIADQEEFDEIRRKKPRTYLETLALSQLELIAIIESPKGNWAMVRDGKGIGYSVRKGTAIGIHDGVVERIGGKEIVIKEKHRDLRGKTKIKRVRKELHTTQ
ncbi:MAG: pilus assembly protein PilP [Deltaproteobacteria bacterium]|nr:pilus assembly protein PilP [Deltaproteobacteria bacterium]MBW2283533.1 pilus assembly protein PilP [Deltaproteobacteria bacterium]